MGGCQGASIRLARRIYASFCAMKGIFHFRYVRALAGRDVRVAGRGAFEGGGQPPFWPAAPSDLRGLSRLGQEYRVTSANRGFSPAGLS